MRQKKLGVGLQLSCWGQACGGMLGSMARIAPAGGTARSTGFKSFSNIYLLLPA
jgi:hypothetical protein